MEGGASSSGAQTGSSSTMASRSSNKKLKMSEMERVINLISKGPTDSQVAVDEEGTPSATGPGDSASDSNNSVLSQAPVNPLQNPLVLTNLFEVCPPGDLAKFRLVCKDWEELSLKAWRTSATLNLERDAKTGRLYTAGEKGRTTLNQFLKYVEDPGKECGMKPFRRMKLDGLSFSSTDTQLERFWNLTGSYLTYLDLRNCRFSATEGFWKMAYVNCPNLKRLSLRFCSFGSGHSGGEPEPPKEPVRGKHEHLKCLHISYTDLPITWLELLSHFESLTSLEVRGCSCSDSVYRSLLNAIKVIREQGGDKLPLRNFGEPPDLFIHHHMASRDNFSLSRELNLPVKLETLFITADPDFAEEVNGILELHSTTVEILHLSNSDHKRRGCRKEWQFPCRVQLGKLRTLVIRDVLMEGTQFLKSAPNLERLSISNDRDGEEGPPVERILDILTDGLAEDTAVLLPKLTKLIYSGWFEGRENLLILAKLMPNVEELEMTLNDGEFSVVCGNWKNLKELTVKTDEEDPLTDKGLTGGSIQIERPDMRWVHKAVQPNITDLKELREFSCDSEELTAISVYHGFLQLPNLETLTLSSKYKRRDHDYANPSLTPLLFGQEARDDLRERGIKLNFKARSTRY